MSRDLAICEAEDTWRFDNDGVLLSAPCVADCNGWCTWPTAISTLPNFGGVCNSDRSDPEPDFDTANENGYLYDADLCCVDYNNPDATGDMVMENGDCSTAQCEFVPYAVTPDDGSSAFSIKMCDSWNDGWNGGVATITQGDNSRTESMQYGHIYSLDGNGNWDNSNIDYQIPTGGIDDDAMPCVETFFSTADGWKTDSEVSIDVQGSLWPGEVFWTLQNASGERVAEGGHGPGPASCPGDCSTDNGDSGSGSGGSGASSSFIVQGNSFNCDTAIHLDL